MSQAEKQLSDADRAKLQKRLAEVNKELAEVNARIEKRKGPDQVDFDELRIRNARRSDERLSQFRDSIIGRAIENWAYGENKGGTRESRAEEVRNAQDIASIGQIRKILGNIKEGEFTSDPQIKSANEQLRISSLLYQYYSANSHDAAQDRFVYDVPKWTLGYQWAGPAGAGLAMLSSMNSSMSSEHNFYQLQSMRNDMTLKYLELLYKTNVFAMNKDQAWLENEQMRGATSVDKVIGRARVEFQNMTAPPYEAYGEAENLRLKYEGQYLNTQSRNRNERRRLDSDMFFGLGGLGQ